MQMDLYDEIVRLRKLGQKCAVATIVQVNGSIPSFESAKILVREDGSFMGTVGGGCVEAEVWNAAREVIETEKPRHLSFSLGQDAAYDEGLICGGQLNIFVEPVIPQPRAFIFGGGHVSKGISKIATLAGFSTSIIDNREAFANQERFPEALEYLRIAEKGQPGMAQVHLSLGKCYRGLRQPEKAKLEFLSAIEADPAAAQPHYLLAQVYRDLQDAKSSEKELSEFEILSKSEKDKAVLNGPQN